MANAEVTFKAVVELGDESKQLLRDLRDRLPGGAGVVAQPRRPARNAMQRQALRAVLKALDGWIGDVQANHDAMEHRNENVGEECWRQFAPGDIRDMVNDAARYLGLAEFPYPTCPKEDTK